MLFQRRTPLPGRDITTRHTQQLDCITVRLRQGSALTQTIVKQVLHRMLDRLRRSLEIGDSETSLKDRRGEGKRCRDLRAHQQQINVGLHDLYIDLSPRNFSPKFQSVVKRRSRLPTHRLQDPAPASYPEETE